MPNTTDDIPGNSPNYMISVDSLEQITGYDFYCDLSDRLESSVEDDTEPTWP